MAGSLMSALWTLGCVGTDSVGLGAGPDVLISGPASPFLPSPF